MVAKTVKASLVSLRIEEELRARLEERAREEDRDLSGLVRRAIRLYLDCPDAPERLAELERRVRELEVQCRRLQQQADALLGQLREAKEELRRTQSRGWFGGLRSR